MILVAAVFQCLGLLFRSDVGEASEIGVFAQRHERCAREAVVTLLARGPFGCGGQQRLPMAVAMAREWAPQLVDDEDGA